MAAAIWPILTTQKELYCLYFLVSFELRTIDSFISSNCHLAIGSYDQKYAMAMY